MILNITSFALGLIVGLCGTWMIRKEQAYARAMLVLVLYIPLNAVAIIIGMVCGWFNAGCWSDAVPFTGMIGWMGCLLGMLTNMCTRPPPKPTLEEDDEF
jgi:ABC-type sulfate transport system permease subunit